MAPRVNPFGLTKANDLSDAQIQDLWVDIGGHGGESLVKLARPAVPMPTFILGGKGSGKTHLMRYCSFAIQKIRFQQKKVPLISGLAGDGYLGIYVRCSGLTASRFQGKGQSPDAWIEIFSYYCELWLGQALLSSIPDLLSDSPHKIAIDSQIARRASELFDVVLPPCASTADLLHRLVTLQRQLDYEVNNAAFTGTLKPDVALTRGKLIFGLPRILSEEIPGLNSILFTYQIDEFENLSEDQQRHINTLVRERENPATFKVGGRQFGLKTRKTFSGDEENVKDSEFDELRLDQRFRENEDTYRDLATNLLARRLQDFASTRRVAGLPERRLADWFTDEDSRWDGQYFVDLVGGLPSSERPHVQKLESELLTAIETGTAGGLNSEADVTSIMRLVAVEEAPLLEKLNVLMLYSAWSRRKNLTVEAQSIAEQCSAFMARKTAPQYKYKLQRYRSDIVAQMQRRSLGRSVYSGLDNFIKMSEGQPRALITLLKHTYDWAIFQGEEPFVDGHISTDAQSKGAQAAADWFYNSMMKAGVGGREILISIDRLAALFRINRYADNPRECSLIGFSASLFDANERAAEVIRLATERSFLVEIGGGQQERNSERITTKLQINRMLVPRWGLPTGRRGIAPFDKRELDAIFDPEADAEFKLIAREWEEKMNAPFNLSKRLKRPEASDFDPDAQNSQSDLFEH